eukprot:282554-Prorocentrum_minimum.AAC.1
MASAASSPARHSALLLRAELESVVAWSAVTGFPSAMSAFASTVAVMCVTPWESSGPVGTSVSSHLAPLQHPPSTPPPCRIPPPYSWYSSLCVGFRGELGVYA